MADKQPLTPEKELLNLIEEEGTSAGDRLLTAKHRSLGFFSIGVLRSRFSFFQSQIEKFFKGKTVSLAVLNRFLLVMLLFLFVYTMAEIGLSIVNLNNGVEAAFSVDIPAVNLQFKQESFLNDVDYYLEKAKKRDIFNVVTKEIKQQAPIKPKAEDVAEKTAHLRLVGISWSDDPDAMVEDTRSKRTIFVKKGDMMNDIKVEDILKDKVVLSYQGTKVDLK